MWRLGIAERPLVAGVLLLCACLIGVGLMSRTDDADPCRIEQTWYAGDVHYYEQIDLRADATGTWISSGAASDARRERKEFTWKRSSTTLSVAYDRDKKRTVDYRLERRRDACYLTFKSHPFLDDDSGFHHFADYP